MERARLAALAALLVVLSISGAVLAASAPVGLVAIATPTWPASTSLLLSEVQTGGASASDEFVELTNAGPATLDLAGLEVAYVTSTGGTVTRKASWTAARALDPGRHLLIANTSGIFAGLADATYSGGFAATGGALVVRPIGGAPIDAVGWGDATNAFVEGSIAPAPAPNASIERKPGGTLGNVDDTNNNAVDFFSQASPNPQNLSAPPVPAPGPSATPGSTPSAVPSASPTPSDMPSPSEIPTPDATAAPSDLPSAAPTPDPTMSPTPLDTPEPTGTPTATPAATADPTPEPTASPTAAPTSAPSLDPTPTPTASTPGATPEPTPTIVSIADARAQSNATVATIQGVLTTRLGALESGRKAFLQDATAGIALYLDAAVTDGLTAGSVIQVSGTLDDRYAERTLRASIADVIQIGDDVLPVADHVASGAVGETVEGLRVTIEGITVGSPTALADGLGIFVDDGSGSVRAILGNEALGIALLPAGTHVQVTGPVGQHDASGTGTTAYRVQATLAGELVVLPAASPSPTPEPTATPRPTATPTPSPAPTSTVAASPTPTATPVPTAAPTETPLPTQPPTPTATPGPTPTPSATPAPTSISIATARSARVGTTVTVEGVVTAEAGRLGTPALLAIADATGAIVVRLPDGLAAPGRGTVLRVTGPTADPYGQLEVRPLASGFRVIGTGVIPSPATITAPELGEASEAALVQLLGTVKTAPTKGTSGDLSIDVVDARGRTFRVAVDGSSGIRTTDIPRNATLRLTGIVGQHASRKGVLDGYRLWLRDVADVALALAAAPGPSSSAGPISVAPISTALAMADGSTVTIEATVTAGVRLLDATGRRLVVQDASGAIEVLLAAGATPPAVGSHVRVTGEKTHAFGAPRLKAAAIAAISGGPSIVPVARATSLGDRDEWRLIRLSGTVTKVERMGDRWRAEVRLPDGDLVPVVGQAGAAIPSTAIVGGKAVTVIGIVRRPYATATDRRFAVLPRGRSDIGIGPGSGGITAGSGTGARGPAGGGRAEDGMPGLASGTSVVTPDTDLATLFEHIGERVHVGGLITELQDDGFLLDDGTAVARVVLHTDGIVLLPHLKVGDALAARGEVEQDGESLLVSVASAADLIRVGDLGQALPALDGLAAGSSDASATVRPPSLAGAGSFEILPAGVSVVMIAGISLVSVLVTVLRRRAAARRSRALVVARLAQLTRR